MIKDLDEQIVQKDAFIKKQEDDMKFYKLELINREHTFNNMFGNNPNVGLLNPMQAANKVGTLGGKPGGLQSANNIPRRKAQV